MMLDDSAQTGCTTSEMHSYHEMIIAPRPFTDANRIDCDVTLPPSHPHLRGHFDGFPVLPGVSQIDLVLHLLGRAAGAPVALTAVQRTKFTAILQPGTTFRTTVEFDDGAARWALQDEDVVYSRGTLTYEFVNA